VVATASSQTTDTGAGTTANAGQSPPTATSRSTSQSNTSTAGGTQAYIAYKVQPGDTVRFIARTYGVSSASIVQASGLSNPDFLRIGQVLTVPSQPGWVYRVQSGETLDQIAARSGVSSDRIATASGMTAASIGPGDVILIPDQSAIAPGK
jgi:LysM repeat protein